MIDLSYIIGCAIAVLLAIICVKVWPVIKAAIPPNALAVVGWLAESVVRAVEAEFGGGNGEAKREEAFKRINEMLAPFIEFCEKMGFTIDAKIVYEAIQAAWYKLNLDQILAGVKQTDTQESK